MNFLRQKEWQRNIPVYCASQTTSLQYGTSSRAPPHADSHSNTCLFSSELALQPYYFSGQEKTKVHTQRLLVPSLQKPCSQD